MKEIIRKILRFDKMRRNTYYHGNDHLNEISKEKINAAGRYYQSLLDGHDTPDKEVSVEI